MTRRSRREIERAVEDLDAEQDTDAVDDADPDGVGLVWEDPETGELYDGFGPDAERIDPDTLPKGGIDALPTIDFSGVDT